MKEEGKEDVIGKGEWRHMRGKEGVVERGEERMRIYRSLRSRGGGGGRITS